MLYENVPFFCFRKTFFFLRMCFWFARFANQAQELVYFSHFFLKKKVSRYQLLRSVGYPTQVFFVVVKFFFCFCFRAAFFFFLCIISGVFAMLLGFLF